MQRPTAVWLLVCLLLVLGFGGLYGGGAMLADPSGGLIQLTDVLPLLPVASFILPGIFLVTAMGCIPLILAYGMLTRPKWTWVEGFSLWTRHHWSWTGTVMLDLLLAVWLAVQGLVIGFEWAIQFVTAGIGCLIMLLAFSPNVREFYRYEESDHG